MAEERSSGALWFIVGGLVVAVLVIAFFVFGDDSGLTPGDQPASEAPASAPADADETPEPQEGAESAEPADGTTEGQN